MSEQVHTAGGDDPLAENAVSAMLETLLLGLGFGKDATHETS
jgi:hypothetical protein